MLTIFAFFLPALLVTGRSGYASTSIPEVAAEWLVSVTQSGQLEKQFPAKIERRGGSYYLQSETNRDIVMIPQNSLQEENAPGPGNYSLTVEHQNLKEETFQATASRQGDAVFFLGKSATDIKLYPKSFDWSIAPVKHWASPFDGKDRNTIKSIQDRVVSRFGDYRSSVKKGHKHAGIDLKGAYGENIHPIGRGRVIFISMRDLNGTVIIKHRTSNEKTIYSKYVHLKDIPVKVGDAVGEDTTIGRFFNKATFVRSRFGHNHFHLELRKNYEDKGRASSYSMTKRALEVNCLDPLKFLEEHLPQ